MNYFSSVPPEIMINHVFSSLSPCLFSSKSKSDKVKEIKLEIEDLNNCSLVCKLFKSFIKKLKEQNSCHYQTFFLSHSVFTKLNENNYLNLALISVEKFFKIQRLDENFLIDGKNSERKLEIKNKVEERSKCRLEGDLLFLDDWLRIKFAIYARKLETRQLLLKDAFLSTWSQTFKNKSSEFHLIIQNMQIENFQSVIEQFGCD
jgi:hypothetical protein